MCLGGALIPSAAISSCSARKIFTDGIFFCFQLTFFDFPAAKNFKELLGADLSISETSSLPEVKQTYFWILMQKLTKDRTRVKISKLHIYQEGKHCRYFYSYNLRYNAIFTFYYNFLDIVLCLPSKYLFKFSFSWEISPY